MMPWSFSSLICGSETKCAHPFGNAPISNAPYPDWRWTGVDRVIWLHVRDGLGPGRGANRRRVCKQSDLPDILVRKKRDPTASAMRPLRDMLDAALVAEPPLQTRDGGFIAPRTHDADLDAARTLRDEGRGVIAKLQADYIADTGVQSLKIKHNNVLGYFIETTATHAQKE
jgi:DNA mismatch repair protein MutS